MSKLISVIIPCYKVENYIDRCINSLLHQTIGLENLELIFINDASPDQTLSKLLDYEKHYPENILVINSEVNMRQGGARNLGLRYASADYIAFLDSDDWLELTAYEKMYDKASTYDCDVVTCRLKRVTEPGTPMGSAGKKDRFYIIETDADRRDFILTGTGEGIGKLYKKSLLIDNDICFPEHLAYEDNYFSALVTMYAEKVYFLEEYLYHYYFNPNSTVVSQNSAHHFDRLTVELLKVETMKNRGFLDKYYHEIEYDFLRLFYLNTLHIVFTRFSEIPVQTLQQMQAQVKALFPNYKDNPYVTTVLDSLRKTLLKTIELPMEEKEWEKLAKSYNNLITLSY